MTAPNLPDAPLPPRPPYRPPIGMPLQGENRWRSAIVATLFHGVLIVLMIFPFLVAQQTFADEPEGAGGAGPAGGGGGGSGGTGGAPRSPEERIRYIQIAPEPTLQPLPTEVPPPVPVPVIPPPEPVVVPPPTPPPPVVEPKVEPPAIITPPVASVIPGVGGGSGNDGSAGMGPGSGGGVGSGIGPGRGSGVGPGTGGGPGTVYPATVTEIGLLPEPPKSLRPYRLVVQVDVDATGKVLNLAFNETKDGGYNKKVRQMLGGLRFRPAVTYEGVPVRSTFTLSFEYY